ncbi:MAG: formate/nitrite transporter family protein [Alphaproteobacteria bacterium]|nr:formate/nitrite transporter family protein [Alphaproteobacteria bacterium]
MADAPPPPPNPSLFDAYTPDQMALRVEKVGMVKAALPTLPLFALAVLAGAFIALGAMFFTLATTGSSLGLGPTRLLGGVAFSLGLILVVVGGAELFTGNVLMVMGWAGGKVPTGALLRNWGIVYVGNFAGGVGMAVLAHAAGLFQMGGGAVGEAALRIAEAKAALPFASALAKGILCNVLVTLAVWLCFAAHSVTDKILAIVFPITAFVALGFEHSIANMYFIPAGMLLSPEGSALSGMGGLAGLAANLVPVTIGNLIGGGVFVAGTYYVVYLRKPGG